MEIQRPLFAEAPGFQPLPKSGPAATVFKTGTETFSISQVSGRFWFLIFFHT